MPGDDKDKDKGALTDEQREEISRSVNAAVTAQLDRKLGAAIAGALGPISAKLDKLAGGKAKDDATDDDDDAGGEPDKGKPGKGRKGKEDPEVAQMRARLKAIEDERAKEREEAAAAKRDGSLRELLTGVKVEPNRLRGAIAVVRDQIKQAEDGSLVATVQRNGYTEDIPAAQFIKEWAGTDEGKAYLAPARNPGGAGTRQRLGGLPPGGASPQRDPKEAKVERKQAAVTQLFDQVGAMLNNGATVDVGGGGE